MSPEVIKEQNLRIILETNISLTCATNPKIVYKKPDGTTTGLWTAEIVGTTLRVDLENKEIDQAGVWYVHSQVNLGADINPHYGKRNSFLVKDLYTI